MQRPTEKGLQVQHFWSRRACAQAPGAPGAQQPGQHGTAWDSSTLGRGGSVQHDLAREAGDEAADDERDGRARAAEHHRLDAGLEVVLLVEARLGRGREVLSVGGRLGEVYLVRGSSR